MKHKILTLALAAIVSLTATSVLTACDDDDDDDATTSDTTTTDDDSSADDETTVNTKYVIVTTVDDASYLVTAESLSDGTVSVSGNGLEVISGTYWVFKDLNYVFALIYNKGSDGTGASYYLDSDASLAEKYSYTFGRITTYGTWGDYVVTASTSSGSETLADSDGNIPYVFIFNYLNSNDGTYSIEDSQLAENYLSDYCYGERVSFAGIVEANDMVYTSVIPMGMSAYGVANYPDGVLSSDYQATADGGSGSGAYTAGTVPYTQYPDQANVAIFTGSSFNETPIIAHTEKMGYACGRYRSQYYQTIWAADNGDVYVFSPGYGRSTTDGDDYKVVTGTLPSAVMRIKAGETDFDSSYYVNLEEIGTQHPVFRCWHATGNYFFLQLYADGVDGISAGTSADVSEYVIFNADDPTTTIAISGLPDDASISGTPYGEDGIMYLPVSVTTGDYPAFYAIDVTTGVATKGLTVECDELETAGKLSY